MTYVKLCAAIGLAASLSACGDIHDKTRDQNIFDGGNGDLSNMTAGIWVDPAGCEHWIIDDGVEGYLDVRLTPDGRPVCNSDLPRSTANGNFKRTSTFFDPL